MYLVMKDGLPEREAIGNITWSPNHFQTAESLSDDERSQFDLYLIVDNQPELTADQKWGESTYAINGTNVIRTWVVVDKTTEEIAADTAALAASVRSERDELIKATDYYALTDVTMNAAMTTYRQALRDITDQAGFPNTITWPIAP